MTTSTSEHPKTKQEQQEDLYLILQLPAHPHGKKCTPAEIKRAYYRLALQFHPDKQPPSASHEELEEAKVKFQRLNYAWSVLGDGGRREVYDRTGRVGAVDLGGVDVGPQISVQDIERFQREYLGSEEESMDVLKAYEQHRGDLLKMLDDLYFGTIDHEQRYREIIQTHIDANRTKSYRAWSTGMTDTKRKKRQRMEEREAEEAEELAGELGIEFRGASGDSNDHSSKNKGKDDSGMPSDLVAMIQKRQQGRMDALVNQLEAKYVTQKKVSKKKK